MLPFWITALLNHCFLEQYLFGLNRISCGCQSWVLLVAARFATSAATSMHLLLACWFSIPQHKGTALYLQVNKAWILYPPCCWIEACFTVDDTGVLQLWRIVNALAGGTTDLNRFGDQMNRVIGMNGKVVGGFVIFGFEGIDYFLNLRAWIIRQELLESVPFDITATQFEKIGRLD